MESTQTAPKSHLKQHSGPFPENMAFPLWEQSIWEGSVQQTRHSDPPADLSPGAHTGESPRQNAPQALQLPGKELTALLRETHEIPRNQDPGAPACHPSGPGTGLNRHFARKAQSQPGGQTKWDTPTTGLRGTNPSQRAAAMKGNKNHFLCKAPRTVKGPSNEEWTDQAGLAEVDPKHTLLEILGPVDGPEPP